MSFTADAFVAPTLYEEVENLTFVVDSAPQPEPPACNRHDHLV
jgi:hypothetical protein